MSTATSVKRQPVHPPYSLRQILAVWAAAAVPMGPALELPR